MPVAIPSANLDLSFHRPRGIPRSPPSRVLTAFDGESSANLSELINLPQRAVQSRMSGFGQTRLQGTGLHSIVLYFSWPGYERYAFSDLVPVAGRTDGQIAMSVAGVFAEFIQKAMKVPGTDPRYAITPQTPFGNIKYLGLRAINYIQADVFTAEVEVLSSCSRMP